MPSPPHRRLHTLLAHLPSSPSSSQPSSPSALSPSSSSFSSSASASVTASAFAHSSSGSTSSPSAAMKALILVGGYGTRLRPLTFSVPKPLVEFCNLPIICHQIEALVAVGVKKVILAVNVQPQAMMKFLKEAEKKYGIEIICSQEDVPMGTAGPLALARAHLLSDKEPFFMLNSDVICDFPLQNMLNFHKKHGGEGTIFVTSVTDPSKYGVVLADENGRIDQFIEKPQKFVSDKINAGIYLLETSVVERVQPKPTSIERDIFPVIAAEKKLYCMALQGYWMDIGQPRDYLSGMVLHLAYVQKTHPKELVQANGKNIIGNVLVHPTAQVAATAVLGPDVVVGPGCVVGDGARVKRTTLMDQVVVQPHAFVSSSIIGWKSNVGSWARVVDSTLGEDVAIANEFAVQEVQVCPHKEIKENITQPRIIL